MSPSLRLVAWSLLGLLLAPAAVRAEPTLTEPTVRRFLRSWGYAATLSGDHTRLKDGSLVALRSVKTPSQLFELTRKLEQSPFAGPMGLRSDRGTMKIWLENLRRADPALVAQKGKEAPPVEAHDRAMSDLVHGEAPLEQRLSAVASEYVRLKSPAIARFLQRKLGRIDGAEQSALLVGAQIAEAKDNRDRMNTQLTELAQTPGLRPETLRKAVRSFAHANPKLGLALARQAHALAADDPASEAMLGIASILAGRYDEYTDAAGVRGSRQAGINAGMAHLARSVQAGAPVEHATLAQQVHPPEGRDRSLLTDAVRLYEAGHLDRAEAAALDALARQKDEGLAHHLITQVRGARLRQAEEALLREQARPRVVTRDADKQSLSARALGAGIERLVPGFSKLSLDRQATIARGLLPWRARWADMSGRDSSIHLVQLDESITEIPTAELGHDDRTMDGRHWYSVRGVANRSEFRAHVGIERVDRVYQGTSEDTFAHEFAHLVHYNMPEHEKAELDRLFKGALADGRIQDAYSRNNVYEYFARGYEMWLSHQEGPVGARIKPEPPGLLSKDRALYDLFTRLTQPGRAAP